MASNRYNRTMSNKTSAPFSNQLESWLRSKHPKTIGGLLTVSSQKSFAVLFMVLMAIPALPLPTGGVSHIFEIITIVVALQLVLGRRTVWLPAAWLRRPLGKSLEQKTLPYLIRKIRWLEKHSRPRLGGLLEDHNFLRLVGLMVVGLSLGAFLAPPFSGLDTLPAMGVVGISLSLILEDIAILVIALILGVVGVVLEITLGAAILKLF